MWYKGYLEQARSDWIAYNTLQVGSIANCFAIAKRQKFIKAYQSYATQILFVLHLTARKLQAAILPDSEEIYKIFVAHK